MLLWNGHSHQILCTHTANVLPQTEQKKKKKKRCKISEDNKNFIPNGMEKLNSANLSHHTKKNLGSLFVIVNFLSNII